MYYLKIISHFDAAHYLREYEGKCATIHGHSWQVQIIVKGETLNHQGLLIDFGDLKRILNDTLNLFDHKLINDIKTFSDGGMNPTAENIASYIYSDLTNKLPTGIILDSVEVRESPRSSAIFRKESL